MFWEKKKKNKVVGSPQSMCVVVGHYLVRPARPPGTVVLIPREGQGFVKRGSADEVLDLRANSQMQRQLSSDQLRVAAAPPAAPALLLLRCGHARFFQIVRRQSSCFRPLVWTALGRHLDVQGMLLIETEVPPTSGTLWAHFKYDQVRGLAKIWLDISSDN